MRIEIHVYVVQASPETTTARRPRSRMRRQVHTHSQSLVREHSFWKYIIYLLYISIYIISSWDTFRPRGWPCPWIFFPAKHCQPILLCASGNQHQQQYYEVIIWKFANEQELWDLLQVFPEPRLSLSWYSEPDPSFPSYIDLWVSSFKVCLQLFLWSIDTWARMLWTDTFTFHRCRLIQVTLTFS